MHSDAYRRAFALLNDKPGLVTKARVLGVLHALLIFGLVMRAGLLATVITTDGETRFPRDRVDDVPPWVARHASGVDRGFLLYDNTGLFPLVAENWTSTNAVHRLAARLINVSLNWFPTLRTNLGALSTLLAAELTLLLILFLVAQARRRVLAEAAGEVSTSLRKQIHRQMLRLGQSSLPTEGTGPVVNLLTREVNDVRDAIFADLDITPRMQVLTAGLVLLSLGISPVLTIFTASLVLLAWWVGRSMHAASKLVSDAALRDAATQLCLLHEDLGLVRTIRVYGMESIDRERFDSHLERFREADVRRMANEGRVNPTLWLFLGSAVILAIFLLGYNVVVSGRIGAASALVLAASLSLLAVPIGEWRRRTKVLTQARRSCNGVYEFLERKPELQQEVGAAFLSPAKERITFEDVSLESRSGRLLLDRVSLEIPAGERTGILSLDEDAKHALVCLIPRLIDPKSGRVRIDGRDVREVTLESIRAQVATVLQADLVFSDSVAVNIGLGDPSYTLPRIIEAAKLAHAHQFIQDLPHGYDTIIGSLAHYLKPDQQFRVALARAILHDPSIVIIEEPSVQIDEDVKPLIDDTIARLGEGRTLIFLPHRLSTIRSCRQVVLLQNGRVDAAGSPRDLQHTNKLFRHIQYVEFNQFAAGEIEAGQMNG